MLFYEKLDFLMKITNTTNSRLAQASALDSSYISRLRRGIRTPANKENYTSVFAEYFARHITLDYQKTALCETADIKASELPQTIKGMSNFIGGWLSGKELPKANPVQSFVEGLSVFTCKTLPSSISQDFFKTSKGMNLSSEVYFGNAGKRDAVIKFLSLVLAQKTSSNLLLYSEEDMSWLTENPEFTAKWAILMSRIIAQGNRIKIIHTVHRSLDEMLFAISQWLPLYMSGAIEPYYYPKHHNGVFKRTLFLAPETAAVMSGAIGAGCENSANYIFTDRAILFSLVDEFNSYLSLCRPLMHIFTKSNSKGYLSALSEFENEQGNSIIKTAGFPSITMPLESVKGILSRSNCSNREEMLSYQRKRIGAFENNLSKNRFTDIVFLHEVSDIISGNIPLGFSDMICDNAPFYTAKEYILHLQNIIRLLEIYDNYNAYIEPKKQTNNIMIYAKDEIGVIIARCDLPSVMFAINESNMTAAFWDYMQDRIKRISREKKDKAKVIGELKSFGNKLEA